MVDTPRPDRSVEEPLLEGEIDFSYYSKSLLRHWKLLVVGAVVGAVVGLVIATTRPTLYEAATTVLTTRGSEGQNISTSRALFENNNLAAQMLKETGLDKPPFSFSPQGFVAGALQIQEVPGTSLVKVKVRLRDPNKAAEASNILSRKGAELNRRIAEAESTSVRGQLEEHVKAASERLRQAEAQLLAYQDDAQVEVLKKDTEAMLYERGDLLKLLIDIETEKARIAAAEQEIQRQEPVLSVGRSVGAEEALRRAAESPTATGALTVGQNPQVAQRREPRGMVTVDPETLDLSNPFVNPVYQTLAFQIATSRTRLAGLERERREMMGRRIGDDRFGKLAELHKRELGLAQREAAYDLAKKVHEDLALRYEQSRTESVSRMVQLQVVDEAIAADQPLPKKRRETTALGFVVGLIIGIAAALVWGSGASVREPPRAM